MEQMPFHRKSTEDRHDTKFLTEQGHFRSFPVPASTNGIPGIAGCLHMPEAAGCQRLTVLTGHRKRPISKAKPSPWRQRGRGLEDG